MKGKLKAETPITLLSEAGNALLAGLGAVVVVVPSTNGWAGAAGIFVSVMGDEIVAGLQAGIGCGARDL